MASGTIHDLCSKNSSKGKNKITNLNYYNVFYRVCINAVDIAKNTGIQESYQKAENFGYNPIL
jgi:hypothetical protein